MALINRSANAVSGVLRAVARKRERYTHDVKAGKHTFTVDEPPSQGGQADDRLGPLSRPEAEQFGRPPVELG